MTDYQTLLAHLYRRAPARTCLGLRRIEALLQRLGRPQDAMLRIVVGGTNGKGSTSALLASALSEAGHRVGLFTSPHLLRFTERIRVQGVEIAPQRVVQLGQRVLEEAASSRNTATFFEVTLTIALLHFVALEVDVAVLEVGVGGRLDATNIAGTHLAVITPIDLDHQDLLGHSLAAIAAEKAAIIAPGRPVVVAPQAPEAAATIVARAQAVAAPLHRVSPPPARLESHQHGSEAAYRPAYQQLNVATAAQACAVLEAEGRVRCPPAAFARAAAAFAWPGRYQWLSAEATAPRRLPCPVILDGGHNPAGAAALQQALTNDPRVAGRQRHLIFAAVQGKNSGAMVAALAPGATTWRTCGLQTRRRHNPEDLAAVVGHGARACADFAAAWADLTADALGAADLVVVTGSLFLVADALAHLTAQRRDPPVDG